MSATLKNIQRSLQGYLLDPQHKPDDLVIETEKVSRDTRLGIYANAYRTRIVEAMAADYCALKTYLGDDEFEALIIAYIDANPSRYFSMRWVGSELGAFIQNTSPYSEHLDLIELARFEWALCDAFDAADKTALRADALATLSAEQWADLTLQFSPSLQLIALKTNVPQLWKALNADEAPPVLTNSSKQVWLIWRRQLKLLFRPADALEVLALEQFRRGNAFGDVCALLAEHLPEEQVPVRAVGFLQQWLQDELIVEP